MKFKVGERVSLGSRTGTIVAVGFGGQLRVKVDGSVALEWPDHWTLGVGPTSSICRECERPFRYAVGEDSFFCPSCDAASRPTPYTPKDTYTRPSAPDVGIHVAGAVAGRDVRTQRCRRCGVILARYCAYDRHADRVVPCTFYRVGALVERTIGGQGVLIRAGAEPTCAEKQPAEVA